MEQPIFFFFDSSYIVLNFFNVLGDQLGIHRTGKSLWWEAFVICIDNQIFKGTGKCILFYDSKLITEVEFILKVQSMSSH